MSNHFHVVLQSDAAQRMVFLGQKACFPRVAIAPALGNGNANNSTSPNLTARGFKTLKTLSL
jgi:hypothetical protein